MAPEAPAEADLAMTGLVRFAREALGVDLWPGQQEIVNAWEASGCRKAALVLGRRSGKSTIAAIAALHNAVAVDYSDHLMAGEQRFIVCVATREAQAAEFTRKCRELLDEARDPDLRELVVEATALEIRLRGGVTIRALPCNSRATRGFAASMVVCDEMAHYQSQEEGAQAARSIWRALSPSIAQFGKMGKILITSTPLGPSGTFYELARAGESGADPDMFVARVPTWEMHPGITEEDLAGEFAADPSGAAAEYGAQWVEGFGSFLDAAAVNACVVSGRRQLPPRVGPKYVIGIDPAFARAGDAFALAVAHAEGDRGDRRVVVDLVRSWRGKAGPLNSDLVLDEVREVCDAYRARTVTSDQFAVVPITDGLRRRGVTVQAKPFTSESKADMYATLRRAINLGQLELVDDQRLAGELVGLRVSPTGSGKPRIQAAGSGHDDLATVTALVVHQLLGKAASDPATVRRYIEGNEESKATAAARSGLGAIGGSGSLGGIDGVLGDTRGPMPRW